MWNKNGFLVCGKQRTNYVASFDYQGICAYWSYPLLEADDEESRKLTAEQISVEVSKNRYVIQEFISNPDLYQRYIDKCKDLKIDVRVLFLESGYSSELWKGKLPDMKFIGYEYCPVPLDEQVITDLDWYEPFNFFKERLNKYGLFDTYEDVVSFMAEYKKAEESGDIGDGGFDGFVFKVNEVII